MKTITSGVFQSVGDAEAAIKDFQDVGVLESEISYIYSNKNGELEEHKATAGPLTSEPIKDTAVGALSGAATGGAVGALAGLVATTGVLPSLGLLVVGGPIAAALGLGAAGAVVAAGAVTGAAAGTFLGAITGLGVSAVDAEIYEARIKGGDVLVIVEALDPRGEIVSEFKDNNAVDVKQYTTP